jgi:uncharacterized protein YpmS
MAMESPDIGVWKLLIKKKKDIGVWKLKFVYYLALLFAVELYFSLVLICRSFSNL